MENYEEVNENIGEGNMGIVRLMRHKVTKELVAIKFIPRGDKRDKYIAREIINHRSVSGHPNIIQLKEVVLTPTDVGIVMEYASGSDLFNFLSQSLTPMREDKARYFFQQIISGLSFCHNMEICHLDMKLENILLAKYCLKICDFGFSKSYSKPKSTVGTPEYMAPEVLYGEEYDGKMADIWSCGVILYAMVVGGLPFGDIEEPLNLIKERIKAVEYKIPSEVNLSEDCKDLIHRIFVADPSKRITMKELKSHPWFLKDLPRELTEEAQAVYYQKQSSTTYLQSTADIIINIVNKAKTLPTIFEKSMQGIIHYFYYTRKLATNIRECQLVQGHLVVAQVMKTTLESKF